MAKSGEVHARWSGRDQDDDVWVLLNQWLYQEVERLSVEVSDVAVLDGLMVMV